jgi:hypothetical protein
MHSKRDECDAWLLRILSPDPSKRFSRRGIDPCSEYTTSSSSLTSVPSWTIRSQPEQLTSLMIDHDVGVSTVALYPLKKIDSDYFDGTA